MKKIYTIAEIAQAHDGSVGILHSLIDCAADAGFDAVKFQTHIADAESSCLEPFRVKFSYVDKTRFDYWKRMELPVEQWRGVMEHCKKRGIDFISSPFSCRAVDLLEEIGCPQYKIGSGEVSNPLLLEKICRTGKKVILSSGMSSFEELDGAVAVIRGHGNDFTVMQCTTAYPTPPERAGFNVLHEIRERYACEVGFSDHSGEIFAGILAAALGADVLEIHITFSKKMFGPDALSSLDPQQQKDFIAGIRYAEKSLGTEVVKNDLAAYTELKKIFGKALSAAHDLPAGCRIGFDDLETKKPQDAGIRANEYRNVLNRRVVRPVKGGDFLSWDDIE